MTTDDRIAALKRRERQLERELDRRDEARMSPSQRQAASLGYAPERSAERDDDTAITPSEHQAARMRRSAAVSEGDDD